MRYFFWLIAIGILALGAQQIVLEESFRNYFVTLSLEQQCLLLSIPTVPLLIVAGVHLKTSKPINQSKLAGYLVAIILVSGSTVAFFVFDAQSKVAFVAAVAATAATMGWVLQWQSAINLSRKQHTLNILTQMRQSEVFNKHRLNIFSHYPGDEVIPAEDAREILQKKDKKEYYQENERGDREYPLIDSIYFILNYYEFLSTAVLFGDIDGDFLYETLGDVVGVTYKKMENIINSVRGIENPSQKPKNDSYANLKWLIETHWKNKNIRKLEKEMRR